MIGGSERIYMDLSEDLRCDVLERSAMRGGKVLLGAAGALTHPGSSTSASSRRDVPSFVKKSGSDHVVEPDGDSLSRRCEWHTSSAHNVSLGAMVHTGFIDSPAFAGHTSKLIASSMRHHGIEVVSLLESLLVDRQNRLAQGQVELSREREGEGGTNLAGRTRWGWRS